MAQKMIYLSDTLMAEAKNIPNFSELMQKLFRDYLQEKQSKTELLTEKDKLQQEKAKLNAELDAKTHKIELAVKKVETIEGQEEAMQERKAHKLADKISACIENTKEMFGKDITETQAVEFLGSTKYRNILHFLEENK